MKLILEAILACCNTQYFLKECVLIGIHNNDSIDRSNQVFCALVKLTHEYMM